MKPKENHCKQKYIILYFSIKMVKKLSMPAHTTATVLIISAICYLMTKPGNEITLFIASFELNIAV
jgi:hypothetical protein